MPGKYAVLTLAICFVLLSFCTPDALGGEDDILILESGKALYGKILEETEEFVTIKCKYGVQTISRDNIREVCRAGEFYETYKNKRDKVEKKRDADEYYKLGLWCEERNRKREANECYNAAVFINPRHRESRLKLGYKRHKDKWYTPDKYNRDVRGLVLHDDEWITKEDKEKYDMGLIKDGDRWVSPEVLAREEKEKSEKLAKARERAKARAARRKKKKGRSIPLPEPMENEKQWMDEQKSKYSWTVAIKTKRYYIFSTAPEDTTEYFGECMDSLFEAYVRKFQFKGRQAKRFTICIFATYQEFVQRCRVPRGVGGFYTPDARVLYVPNGLPRGANMSTINVLAHEGHHQFQHFSIGDVMKPMTGNAIWVIEGGATYCEVAEFAEGKATIGLVNPERLRRLKAAMNRGNYVKLAQLTRMGQRGFTAYHYDHAWGFLYYMMTEYTNKYVEFFNALKVTDTGDNIPGIPAVPPGRGGGGGPRPQPPDVMAKFTDIVKKTVPDLEDPWKDYILGLQ